MRKHTGLPHLQITTSPHFVTTNLLRNIAPIQLHNALFCTWVLRRFRRVALGLLRRALITIGGGRGDAIAIVACCVGCVGQLVGYSAGLDVRQFTARTGRRSCAYYKQG